MAVNGQGQRGYGQILHHIALAFVHICVQRDCHLIFHQFGDRHLKQVYIVNHLLKQDPVTNSELATAVGEEKISSASIGLEDGHIHAAVLQFLFMALAAVVEGQKPKVIDLCLSLSGDIGVSIRSFRSPLQYGLLQFIVFLQLCESLTGLLTIGIRPDYSP